MQSSALPCFISFSVCLCFFAFSSFFLPTLYSRNEMYKKRGKKLTEQYEIAQETSCRVKIAYGPIIGRHRPIKTYIFFRSNCLFTFGKMTFFFAFNSIEKRASLIECFTLSLRKHLTFSSKAILASINQHLNTIYLMRDGWFGWLGDLQYLLGHNEINVQRLTLSPFFPHFEHVLLIPFVHMCRLSGVVLCFPFNIYYHIALNAVTIHVVLMCVYVLKRAIE